MRKITLSLFLITTIFFAGCGGDNPDYATKLDEITGIWKSDPPGDAMEITLGGSIEKALRIADVKNGNTFSGGAFHFEGQDVVAVGEGFFSCPPDTRGIYKIEFLLSGNIKFHVIEDPCFTRISYLAGQQVEPVIDREWVPVP